MCWGVVLLMLLGGGASKGGSLREKLGLEVGGEDGVWAGLSLMCMIMCIRGVEEEEALYACKIFDHMVMKRR